MAEEYENMIDHISAFTCVQQDLGTHGRFQRNTKTALPEVLVYETFVKMCRGAFIGLTGWGFSVS